MTTGTLRKFEVVIEVAGRPVTLYVFESDEIRARRKAENLAYQMGRKADARGVYTR